MGVGAWHAHTAVQAQVAAAAAHRRCHLQHLPVSMGEFQGAEQSSAAKQPEAALCVNTIHTILLNLRDFYYSAVSCLVALPDVAPLQYIADTLDCGLCAFCYARVACIVVGAASCSAGKLTGRHGHTSGRRSKL